MPRRGRVELATARTLRGMEQVHPAHEGLAASVLMLARLLDSVAIPEPDPDAEKADGLNMDKQLSAAAQVAREYRVTLTALTESGKADDTDPLAGLGALLCAPVEHGAR